MPLFRLYTHAKKTIRLYIRQRTLPLSVDDAEEKREFFAKLYFLSGLAAFSMMTYRIYQKSMSSKKDDLTVPIGEAVVETCMVKGKVRIVNFDKFTKVNDYLYERKDKVDEESELIVDHATREKSQADSSNFEVEHSKGEESQELLLE